MEEKKTSIIAVLEILKKYSDEYHVLTQTQLSDYLKKEYNLDLDRRTIYTNIRMLSEYGYDISTFNDNGKGYYLIDRDFEVSEVLLMANAIHASNFIPLNASKELVNKLLNTQSKYVQGDYRKMVYLDNSNKKNNKDFFLNIDILSNAITSKKAVKFDYLKYDYNKKLVKRREESYIVSPYHLVYKNEKSYLIGKFKNHDNLTHFRVDKIKNISLCEEGFVKLTNDEDPYQYAKDRIYMFSGQTIPVTILCDEMILDDVIDIFGTDITIQKEDDNKFKAIVHSTEQGMLYTALQYLSHMEVIKPDSLKEKVRETLKEGLEKYL